jgi:molecular chaperone GrpE
MTDKTKKLSRKDLEQQAGEHLAGWQKALADYQNLQKETQNKMANFKDLNTSSLVLEILPIFDNYEVAITHIPADQQQKSWAVGLQHILKLWQTFLEENQIIAIKTIGEEFDPYIHEAVEQVQDKSQEDNIITKQLQTGFMLKDQVIRPAKVVVNINNIK